MPAKLGEAPVCRASRLNDISHTFLILSSPRTSHGCPSGTKMIQMSNLTVGKTSQRNRQSEKRFQTMFLRLSCCPDLVTLYSREILQCVGESRTASLFVSRPLRSQLFQSCLYFVALRRE